MTRRFRPLLKWPGGKGREWREIEPFVPGEVRNFVDPFMGGLAPFARTPFEGRAFLNDRHERLVDLHVRVQSRDAALFDALRAIADDWDALGAVADVLGETFAAAVTTARGGERPAAEPMGEQVRQVLERGPLNRSASPGGSAAHFIAHSALDKSRRLAGLERKHGMTFGDDELLRHLETAVRAGYYTLIRDHERSASGADAVADFLFVRDYCYGSMFRVNAAGQFNIPYGGASYNAKGFHSRVDQLASDDVAAALARATFSCEDFQAFLGSCAEWLGPEDFVFVDPPYHSDFSTYGPNAFGLDDHRRLAETLASLGSRWLLVIKDTPTVRELYAGPAMEAGGGRLRHEFGKQYGYNVRGRNVRDTRHLLIANYEA